MGEWLTEVIKLATRPRYSFSFWLVPVIVLSVPIPLFETLKAEWGKHLAIIALTFFIIWVVEISLLCYEHVQLKLKQSEHNAQVLAHLDSLNWDESYLLCHALRNKTQTITVHNYNDAVWSLVHKELLIAVPGKSDYRSKPFTVPHAIWQELTSNDRFVERTISRYPTMRQKYPDLFKPKVQP